MAKMGKSFEDTFNKIKLAIGEMVVALGPLINAVMDLVNAAAPVLSFAAGGVSDGVNLLGAAFGSDESDAALLKKYGMRRVNGQLTSLAGDAEGNYVSQGGTTQGYYSGVLGGNQTRGLGAEEMARLGYGGAAGSRESTPYDHRDAMIIKALVKAANDGRAKYIEANKGKWQEQAQKAAEEAGRREANEILRSATGGGLGNFDAASFGGNLGELSGTQWERWEADAEIANFDLEKYTGADVGGGAGNEGRLAKMFGPLEEFSGYTMAFQALQGAVSSAMGAWIDDSSTAGEAVKKFIAESMKANAQLMAAEAIKEGAYALSELAWGNVGKAAGHGASALKFGAAAAAFAVGAKAMHSGGSAGAGSAAPTYNAGAGSAPAEKHTTIVVGSAFLPEGSPRQRQLAANKIVESALGSGGVTYAS
jgi:hypothetical protein